ncbi:MAG: PDZ domain-containing protein [Dehalococcoidia bacterium]|nr:PDZ domain-containing protein [Dehalococcoidia bacterium]
MLRRYRRPPFGARIADAATITAKQGGLPLFGAYVGTVAEQSVAARVGLQPGDIITEFNLRPIRNADDLTAAVAAVPDGGAVVVVWTRGAQTMRGEALFSASATGT